MIDRFTNLCWTDHCIRQKTRHMNTTAAAIPIRLDIDTVAPRFSRALAGLDAATTTDLDGAGIGSTLRELVRIRASQLNGCAYCVNLHIRDAVRGGESVGRIAAVG